MSHSKHVVLKLMREFPNGTWFGSKSDKLGWKGEVEKRKIDGKFKEAQSRGLERSLGETGQALEFKSILNFLSLSNFRI